MMLVKFSLPPHIFTLCVQSTDTDERLEVTMLLAKMFSLKTSKLAVENRPLWNCFLGRFVHNYLNSMENRPL